MIDPREEEQVPSDGEETLLGKKESPKKTRLFAVGVCLLLIVIIAVTVPVVIYLKDRNSSSSLPYYLQSNVMVAMKDGVHLATDIYFPSKDLGGKQYPVLLYRTPYNKSEETANERSTAAPAVDVYPKDVASIFVSHGYIVIYQDNRGRYLSEGTFTKYLDDASDGYDTIQWIENQSWCNGQVAMYGLSYCAHVIMAAMSNDPEPLKTAVIDMGGFSNSYQGGTRQGGTLELKQVTWAWNAANEAPEVTSNETLQNILAQINIFDWFNASSMPWKKGNNPLQYTPDYEDYLLEQWENGNFTDYWKQKGIYAQGYYDIMPDIPTVHLSGWYDVYSRTASDNFKGLTALKHSSTFLILGPWTHGGHARTYAGDVDFGVKSTLDSNLDFNYTMFRLHWFDYWIRGINNSVNTMPKVQIFIMGGGSGNKLSSSGRLDHGGQWRGESAWPLVQTVYTDYYFLPNGSLTSLVPAGPATDNRTFIYNPYDPVPSIGGSITSGAPIMIGGPFNQVTDDRFYPATPPYQPLANRSDVLVFTTPPLDQDVEVTGEINVTLYISSNCTDTDFTAKLVDVYPPNVDYPDGFALNIQDGIMRCRYRDSWVTPSLMIPDTVYSVTVTFYPTSNLFKQGHRIRVDLSSSNFPHFDLNPNTGELEGQSTTNFIAKNTIYMNAVYASHIHLPIIPTSGWK